MFRRAIRQSLRWPICFELTLPSLPRSSSTSKVAGRHVQVFRESSSLCRRRSSHFPAPDYVYLYWRGDGTDDVSKVRDLSVGALFPSTYRRQRDGTKLKLEFLVQEGPFRAEAVVKRWEAANGLGLFTAISDEDRHRLAALLGRLRSFRTETRRKNAALQAHQESPG